MKRLPLAIWAMVIGAFAMGADEFIVAGVVEPIAEDLNVTLGAGGLFESAYALGVAIGAPLFTAIVGLFVYGVAAFAVVAPLQLRVMTQAGNAPDVASAANISAFTLGSALGIWLGGAAIDAGLGLTSVNWVGGLISLTGFALALVSWLWLDRGDRPRSFTSGPAAHSAAGHH